MTSATVVKLPERSEVNEADTWDLSKLFANDSGWDTAFNEFEATRNSAGRWPTAQQTSRSVWILTPKSIAWPSEWATTPI
jgi:oligoendopeptidase F